MSTTKTLPLDTPVWFGDSSAGEGKTVTFMIDFINPTNPQDQVNTQVNLLSDDEDRLLHISCRRNEHVIVFNSRKAGGEWGKEERVQNHSLWENGTATIGVQVSADTYTCSINYSPIHVYNKRIAKEAKGALYKADQTSSFGNPIKVVIQ
jgi:hypothetical protein